MDRISQLARRIPNRFKAEYFPKFAPPISFGSGLDILFRPTVKPDATGNVIREEPLPVWTNFRQRALATAIAEINKKTNLHIQFEGEERLSHRVNVLNFKIKTRAKPKQGGTKS